MFPSASFLQTTTGKIHSSPLWSQGLQGIPQVLSSPFSRIPIETYRNQDPSLFFASQPSVPLPSLLPSLVTPPSKRVTTSRCQQPPVPPMSPVQVATLGHGEVSSSQAPKQQQRNLTEKSHFPVIFMLGSTRPSRDRYGAAACARNFAVSTGAWG